MASLTIEAQQLIGRDRLGSPLRVYGPHTILHIIGGLFLTAFAVLWTVFVLFFVLFAKNISNLNQFFHGFIPSFSSFPSDQTSNTFNTAFSTFGTISTIVGIVFSIFGAFFFFFGLWIIVRAIHNRGMRAAVCAYGVAFVQPSGSDSFRWEDVLTGFHRMSVNVSTTQNQSTGFATTTTTIRHTYTVHCHDGRKFVFKSPLAGVQDLREDIEVQLARLKHWQSQQRIY